MEDIQDRIVKVDIEQEMKSSYIDYSMSVIVARALPDVRDGFKPVHRRVLFGMNELGLTANKETKKSARIVGEVLGKYHPHGDSSVYGTLVRLAQDWILRYPLVYGQGNFGSVDGDTPAAMRYTEAKLQKIAEDVMADLYKNTVDFQKNFDEELEEPTVMPTKIPQLIVNGSSGIAVGMATNMAPHNLSEAVDACIAYIDNNDITTDELMEHIKGPDFPTGGIICGLEGVREAFETGRGRIVIRSKCEIETDENTGRQLIVVNEIPYMVNKRELIENISDLAKDHKIDGISNINDETDREGMRIVIEVKRDANANVLLNKLFKMTQLEYTFNVNNIALVKGRPKLLSMKQLIAEFVDFRHEVVTRRTKFELEKALERAHILEALIIAVDNIDEVIAIIKNSKTEDDAKKGLMARFNFDEIQAQAIVDMRLGALTNLRVEKLRAEFDELQKLIAHLNEILASFDLRMSIIKDELTEMKDKYGDKRRTEIMAVFGEEEDSTIPDDEMVITISHLGYIKKTPLREYKSQGRGGVGSRGSSSRDSDFIETIYQASNRSMLMFFTHKGRCYWLKVYQLPEGDKTGKGRAIQNLLSLEGDDKVDVCIKVKTLKDEEFNNSHYLLFCTKEGIVKKTTLAAYQNVRAKGVAAINLNDGDELIDVHLTNGNQEIMIANRNGRAIHFNENDVRVMGRNSTGVRGMKLDDDAEDQIIGMIAVADPEKESVLVISEKGFGKRSKIEDYRVTKRGAKGVKTLNVSDKTGKVVALKVVTDENDVMIINKSGITLRMPMSGVRVMGRATQGVKLINLTKRKDEIASACVVDHQDEEISEDIIVPESEQDDNSQNNEDNKE